MSIPSNLVPTSILQLPEDPVPSDLGWMMYVNNGVTYKVQVNAVLNVSGVPATRVVAAGTGLTGGGALSSNITLSVAPGGIGATQLDATGVAAGVYGDANNFPSFTVDSNGRLTTATTFPVPSTAGFVPTSRQVIAGSGLLGGGYLSANVTLTADFSDVLPQPLGTETAGTSIELSRGDHVHPAVDLADTTQTTGVLDPTRGGTGTALTSPAAGGIVYSDGANLQVSGAGIAGQVLASNGTGAPSWLTISGVGTVTSVDVSGGTTGLTFSGGPVTTSGTITMAGTLDVDNGGTGATTAAGARSNLSAAILGANNDITSMTGLTGGIVYPDFITFDTTPETIPTAAGSLYWDSADGNQTLSLVMTGGNAIQQIGEEQYYRVKASSTITEGQVVMFTGTVGASGALTAAPATGLTKTTATYIMGVATENIAANNWGYITSFGLVRGIDTSGGAEAWVDGQILYYNPLVAGGLTKTVPTAPAAKVQVAAVVNASSGGSGSLFVRPTFGFALTNLNDVESSSPATNDLLQYTAGGYWTHVQPSAVTGIGSLANALTIGTGLSGTSYNGSTAVTIAIANSGVTANTYGSASTVPVFAVNAQGQITSVTNTNIAIAYTAVSGLGTAAVLNAGVAGGVATLDGGGTVPTSQLPAAVLGSVKYQGTWNATTNSPTLTSSVGTQGYYYVVDVAGSTDLNGITDWKVGDWAIFNGSIWQKIDNTDAVTSVNGYTGTVVLTYSDVGAPSTSGTGATGTWGISISGTAANATNVAVTSDATNTSRYLAFVGASSGNTGVLVDTDLAYNPSTNTLTVGTLNATTGISGGTF